ncbi:hypothetical protein ACWOBE_01730 [Hutsoniella sourekii]
MNGSANSRKSTAGSQSHHLPQSQDQESGVRETPYKCYNIRVSRWQASQTVEVYLYQNYLEIISTNDILGLIQIGVEHIMIPYRKIARVDFGENYSFLYTLVGIASIIIGYLVAIPGIKWPFVIIGILTIFSSFRKVFSLDGTFSTSLTAQGISFPILPMNRQDLEDLYEDLRLHFGV